MEWGGSSWSSQTTVVPCIIRSGHGLHALAARQSHQEPMTGNLRGYPNAFESPRPVTFRRQHQCYQCRGVRGRLKRSTNSQNHCTCSCFAWAPLSLKISLSKCTSSWLLLPSPLFTILLLSSSPYFYCTIIQVLTFIYGDVQFYPVFRFHIRVPFLGNSGTFLGPLAHSSKMKWGLRK